MWHAGFKLKCSLCHDKGITHVLSSETKWQTQTYQASGNTDTEYKIRIQFKLWPRWHAYKRSLYKWYNRRNKKHGTYWHAARAETFRNYACTIQINYTSNSNNRLIQISALRWFKYFKGHRNKNKCGKQTKRSVNNRLGLQSIQMENTHQMGSMAMKSHNQKWTNRFNERAQWVEQMDVPKQTSEELTVTLNPQNAKRR